MQKFQLQKSLKALKTLIRDIETNSYIPPKFRRAPFTEELRLEYLSYLFRERARLERLISPPVVIIPAPRTIQ